VALLSICCVLSANFRCVSLCLVIVDYSEAGDVVVLENAVLVLSFVRMLVI
jgi:hypothetical protein